MNRNAFVKILSFIFVVLVVIWTSSCNSKSGPCDLDTPKEINHTIIPPDSVVVTWTSVPDANGYEVTLIDSTNQNEVLETVFTTDTTYAKGGLVPGSTYKVEVRSACAKNNISDNPPQVELISMPGIIMGDIVVMMENGPCMDDCVCSDSTELLYNSMNPIGPLVSNKRRVYSIEVSAGTNTRQFKLGFNNDCHEVCFYKDKCNTPEQNDDIDLIPEGAGPGVQIVDVNVVGGPSVQIVTHYSLNGALVKTIYLEFRSPGPGTIIKVFECKTSGGSKDWDETCP